MVKYNFQFILIILLIGSIATKELTIITLNIQETPLQDQDLRNKSLRILNETTTEDTYYYLNNKSKKESSLFEITGNSIFDAFYAAYILHGDVMISASDIWLSINHRLGYEINIDPKRFKQFFVANERKNAKEIEIDSSSNNWINFPSSENRWDILLDKFIDITREYTVGDIYNLMKNDFSSTTIVELSATNICLMSQKKQQGQYNMILPNCGIQNVHFVGGVEDFQHLATKLENLIGKYPLNIEFKQSLEKILNIVNIFIDQIKDPQKVDVEFWNQIFDEDFIYISDGNSESIDPEPVISGWISSFFGIDFLEKASIPSFSSSTQLLVIDQIRGIEQKLLIETDMKGIEEVTPNIFKPICNIYVTSSKELSTEQINQGFITEQQQFQQKEQQLLDDEKQQYYDEDNQQQSHQNKQQSFDVEKGYSFNEEMDDTFDEDKEEYLHEL